MRLGNTYKKIMDLDCFDPILVSDTELFVDPFSVFDEKEGFFANSYEKILRFFNEGFKLAASAQKDKTTLSYRKLESMMLFPEINELGLGYSDKNSGSGASKFFRDQIIGAIYNSIEKGLTEYRHFEEIGIFEEGIGCDRISDITCNILKEDIIAYTQHICKTLDIPMCEFKMKHIRFDFNNLRWINGAVELPINKYKNRGILLVPEKFLNDLPTINSDGFRDYIWDNQNETLRNDLNYTLKRDLDKKAIVQIARENPQWVKDYESKTERIGFTPYNLKTDSKGTYVWASQSVQDFVKNNPLRFSNKQEFFSCISQMCDEFKNFVENEKGYELLWNENGRHKPESAVQLLLYGLTKAYCMFLNIDITKEGNAGSGPVDFKYSQGYSQRVLLETKLMSNTRYWNGLEKQLPQYMLAEGIDKGVFMLVAFTIEEFNKGNEFIDKIKKLNLPYDISTLIIDATREKTSASKL